MQPESMPVFTNLGFLSPDSRKPLPGVAHWRTQTRLAAVIRTIEELLRDRCRKELDATREKAEKARRNYESMQGSIIRECLLLEQLLRCGPARGSAQQGPLDSLKIRDIEKAIQSRKANLSALEEFSQEAKSELDARRKFLAGWQRLSDACHWHSTFPDVPEDSRSQALANNRQARIIQWLDRNHALLDQPEHPLLSEIPALAKPLRELVKAKSRLEIMVKGRLRLSARATVRTAIQGSRAGDPEPGRQIHECPVNRPIRDAS